MNRTFEMPCSMHENHPFFYSHVTVFTFSSASSGPATLPGVGFACQCSILISSHSLNDCVTAFIIRRRVFYWELNQSQIPYATSSGTRVAYFPYVTFVSVVSSMTSRFPPFAFVELVSPYNKRNVTRWLEDMNFMLSWQEQYLTRSLRSLVLFLPLEHKIHIYSPPCNILYIFLTWCMIIPRESSLETQRWLCLALKKAQFLILFPEN